VRAVCEFAKDVVFVDGGNSFNPYALTALAPHLGMDRRELLAMVHVARAFTAYQMYTLINTHLQYSISRWHPALLIVSCIQNLLPAPHSVGIGAGAGAAEDVYEEARAMLVHSLQKLRTLTARNELITLLTSCTGACSGLYSYSNSPPAPSMLTALLYECVDRTVKFKNSYAKAKTRRRKRGCDSKLIIVMDGKVMEYRPVPPEQLTLDDFIYAYMHHENPNGKYYRIPVYRRWSDG
jgi:hypothetical protein